MFNCYHVYSKLNAAWSDLIQCPDPACKRRSITTSINLCSTLYHLTNEQSVQPDWTVVWRSTGKVSGRCPKHQPHFGSIDERRYRPYCTITIFKFRLNRFPHLVNSFLNSEDREHGSDVEPDWGVTHMLAWTYSESACKNKFLDRLWRDWPSTISKRRTDGISDIGIKFSVSDEAVWVELEGFGIACLRESRDYWRF